MLENTGVFKHSLPLRKGLALSQAGVRNLKNTVWKTLFGTARISTEVRNGESTVGGPKWTKMDLCRPKWTKMDHFGLANAIKSSSEEGHFDRNGRLDPFGPFWSSTLSDSAAASP